MHIHIVPNLRAPPTVLLRESYREGHKVCKRTLANLSDLSPLQIQAIRASMRGQVLQPVEQTFEIGSSRAHGHVQAVWLAMQRLGLAWLVASKPCSERDLVLAMVAQRIVSPATKLATMRLWHTSTLAADFGVPDASEHFNPARGAGVPEETTMRYKVNGSVEMTDTSLVRACGVDGRRGASPSLSMVREPSVTLVSAAMRIPFMRWS